MIKKWTNETITYKRLNEIFVFTPRKLWLKELEHILKYGDYQMFKDEVK